jgi:AcrR family transcriptional regulator
MSPRRPVQQATVAEALPKVVVASEPAVRPRLSRGAVGAVGPGGTRSIGARAGAGGTRKANDGAEAEGRASGDADASAAGRSTGGLLAAGPSTSAAALSPRGARTREKLRQAAYQVFRDAGYEATTVDAVCEAAAVSKGAFYFHYQAKQDVFIDILEVWSREITEQVEVQFTATSGAKDSLSAVREALTREIHRGRVIVPLWLEFTVRARHDPAVRQALAAFYQRGRSAVADILRPGVPWLPPADLDALSRTVFGAYIGVLMQEIADPEGADADDAVDAVIGVLRGLVSAARGR